MKKFNSQNICNGVGPMLDKMGERHWAAGKAEAYGGAGAALAIVLVLLQIKLEDSWRVASLCLAALSIPIWVGLAYISTAREVWGLTHRYHPELTIYAAYFSFAFLVCGLMLIGSLACLLASFNWAIATAFLCLGIAMIIIVCMHSAIVQRHTIGTGASK